MILIADSGSSNTSWCLIPQSDNKTSEYSNNHQNGRVFFTTEGYNPYYLTQSYLVESLTKSLPAGYDWNKVKQVGFYGAGCSENKYDFIREALQKVFVNACIDVAMDLSAAARALLGHKAGFAAILGTGTNSCLYDGTDIIKNIDSLGFILGDEGSGAYIGRRLLRDYMRELAPDDVSALLKKTYELDIDDIFEQVYTKPFANKYCASFCVFINEHRNRYPYLNDIVIDSFRDLFKNIISHYPAYKQYNFNCVGSVAYHFQDILATVCGEFDMPLGKIIQSPLEGLIEYYLKNK